MKFHMIASLVDSLLNFREPLQAVLKKRSLQAHVTRLTYWFRPITLRANGEALSATSK